MGSCKYPEKHVEITSDFHNVMKQWVQLGHLNKRYMEFLVLHLQLFCQFGIFHHAKLHQIEIMSKLKGIPKKYSWQQRDSDSHTQEVGGAHPELKVGRGWQPQGGFTPK